MIERPELEEIINVPRHPESHSFLRRRLAAAAIAAAMTFAGAAIAQPAPGADLPTGLPAEMFYELLLADIALQRGDAPVAARAYLEVARKLNDAQLARRAT